MACASVGQVAALVVAVAVVGTAAVVALVAGVVVAGGDVDDVVVELLLAEPQPVRSKPTVRAPPAQRIPFITTPTIRPRSMSDKWSATESLTGGEEPRPRVTPVPRGDRWLGRPGGAFHPSLLTLAEGGTVTQDPRGMAMDAFWLDRYLDASVLHAIAGTMQGEEELASLLRFFSSDVRYEDVRQRPFSKATTASGRCARWPTSGRPTSSSGSSRVRLMGRCSALRPRPWV